MNEGAAQIAPTELIRLCQLLECSPLGRVEDALVRPFIVCVVELDVFDFHDSSAAAPRCKRNTLLKTALYWQEKQRLPTVYASQL